MSEVLAFEIKEDFFTQRLHSYGMQVPHVDKFSTERQSLTGLLENNNKR